MELYLEIRKLYEHFCDLINLHESVKELDSRSNSDYHLDAIEFYEKGVEICDRYFKGEHILWFVEELCKNTFYSEVLIVKRFIECPMELEQVKIIEDTYVTAEVEPDSD